VYKWIFCIEMSCVYSTAQNDKAAKFEEWFSPRCSINQENLCDKIMQRIIYTHHREVATLCTHLSLFCRGHVHVCQVFCWSSSMLSCIPCSVRVSSFIQLVLLLTCFEYFSQFSLASLILYFFPAILSLISTSVSCKLFEPLMELNG
jgi:hypothetical protein